MKTISIREIPAKKEVSTMKAPIRVCMHFAHSTDPRVMRDAIALVEAGYAVTIVDFARDKTRPAEEDIRGVHFKHIFMPSYFTSARFKPWFLVKLVIVTIRGMIELLKAQTDIYHAHVERAIPACYVAARLRHKPFIVDTPELTLTDPTYARWSRLNSLAKRLIRHMVSYSARYITASPLYPQELNKLFGAKEMTVILNVPPYREVVKSDRLRQHLNLGPEVRIALYQGFLLHDRLLDRYIRAANFLEPNVVIVFLGSGPEEIVSELKSLIASEGVADRVKIVSAVPYDELLEWTASADIGLTAAAPDQSLNNRLCLPNKFFEYLMAGLPVLSLQYDAIVEMIGRYNLGKAISSVAPQDIGAAINEMLADPEGLVCMSANALAIARQEFYWEKESQKLLRLYEEILSKCETKLAI